MSSPKSLTEPKQKASSTPVRRLKIKSNSAMLGFDFLFQFTHTSAVAAAGVTRAQILKMTGQISTTTAHCFEEVDPVAVSLHYPYAEASLAGRGPRWGRCSRSNSPTWRS